ncbi:STAS domain-containing protein [Streptomyces dubilierae]|uniref:STAS domain-containing protein n=1 Tax=Streptomyces dubilierae TaxID=3075533 RepID=A0ABU2P3F0_9ACTN|nr:STAS domain-containing protein [Streptomyces sp. DSM 41921]MDT0386347.1 STAS domain-containing protein [Streptomyces sp. DSM 41921]
MPWDEAAAPALMSGSSGVSLPRQSAGPASRGAEVAQYGWRGAWVVVARGAYDMDSVTPLADALETAARTHPKVILDASGVTFADSTFLNLLILTHRTVTLRVVDPSPQVRRLCEITGVDGLLELRATVDDAAAS